MVEWFSYFLGAENGKNHTTIGSALLGIEPNVSNIPPRRVRSGVLSSIDLGIALTLTMIPTRGLQ